MGQGRISKGSCSFCRKRRLRCDLNVPQCGRCRKENQACLYGTTPLRWVGGAAIRGRLAQTSPSANSEDEALSVEVSRSPNRPSLENPHLLSYFESVVLPRFQLADEQVELDLDVISEIKPLQQAIVALSQAHYRFNAKDLSAKTTIIRKETRQAAIESFRKLLETEVSTDNTAQQLFTVNVLLCMLDGIIEPTDEELNASICHLKGGFAILTKWNSTITQMLTGNGLQTHLLSIFATMDLVHAMLSGDKPYFEPVFWFMFADVQTWWGCLTVGDRFLAILKHFANLATLGNLVYSNISDSNVTQLVARCLPEMEQARVANTVPTQFTSDHARHWSIFCSIYECCGDIYSARALQLKKVDDEAVQSATRRGVGLLAEGALPGMMSHCLIFPILVIGVHCIYTQDRQAVLRSLSPSSSYLSFGSLQVMVDFLQETWQHDKATTTWWLCFEKVSNRAFFF